VKEFDCKKLSFLSIWGAQVIWYYWFRFGFG